MYWLYIHLYIIMIFMIYFQCNKGRIQEVNVDVGKTGKKTIFGKFCSDADIMVFEFGQIPFAIWTNTFYHSDCWKALFLSSVPMASSCNDDCKAKQNIANKHCHIIIIIYIILLLMTIFEKVALAVLTWRPTLSWDKSNHPRKGPMSSSSARGWP